MKKVTILGSGNWGSVIAKIIGENVQKLKDYDKTVNMWVYEELIDGKKLTEIINETHENVKYLPNIKLPTNVVAVPDIVESVRGSNLLVFVIPHQFIKRILGNLNGKIEKDAIGISLIKGIEFDEKKEKPVLISELISNELNIDMSVLMGANIANEIAEEKFSETTIGSNNLEKANHFWKPIFNTSYFRVNCVEEVFGVEVCGSIKNVIALAAGICDGLDQGNNTKSAFIRIGIEEMRGFIRFFNKNVKEQIYFESCGIADVLTTCLGGRNRKFAMEYAKREGNVNIQNLEKELMNGQQLQGLGTLEGVYSIINQNNLHSNFPLFVTLYKIFFQSAPVKSIFTL